MKTYNMHKLKLYGKNSSFLRSNGIKKSRFLNFQGELGPKLPLELQVLFIHAIWSTFVSPNKTCKTLPAHRQNIIFICYVMISILIVLLFFLTAGCGYKLHFQPMKFQRTGLLRIVQGGFVPRVICKLAKRMNNSLEVLTAGLSSLIHKTPV